MERANFITEHDDFVIVRGIFVTYRAAFVVERGGFLTDRDAFIIDRGKFDITCLFNYKVVRCFRHRVW